MINRVADGQYIIPNLMASFLENWSRDPIPVVTLNSLEYFDSAFGFYLWIKIMGIQSEWMWTCESSIFTAVFDPGVFEHLHLHDSKKICINKWRAAFRAVLVWWFKIRIPGLFVYKLTYSMHDLWSMQYQDRSWWKRRREKYVILKAETS